jgi:hypothetical protein
MRRINEITTFEDIIKPYLLRYAGAKEFNNSGKCVSLLVRLARSHSKQRKSRRPYRILYCSTLTFKHSSNIMRLIWIWTPRALSARRGLKPHWYDLLAHSVRPSTPIDHTSCRPKNLGPLTIFRRFVHGRVPSIDGNENGTLKQPSMSETV